MALKIPKMEYDKKINKKEGKEILEFAEHYIETFKDDIAEQTYDKAISTRFLGHGPYKILIRRRENFSDDEVDDPEFFYIQKYKKAVSRLVGITEHPNPMTITNREDFPKLKDLLNFFEHQGYLTEKQRNLINFLLRKYPRSEVPASFSGKIGTILRHHIKKNFMKVDTAQEMAEILTTELKEKSVIPKKKMFFSLSQIRNELSN